MTISKGELIRLRKVSPTCGKDQGISIENKNSQAITAFAALSELSTRPTFDLSVRDSLSSGPFAKVIMPLATASLSTAITIRFEG